MPDESELREQRIANPSPPLAGKVHAPVLGLVVPQSFKAEMVRRGIAPSQLTPWWSPDAERKLDPLDDPEIRAAVRHCMNDVWHAPSDIPSYRETMEEAIDLLRFPNEHDIRSFLKRVTP